MAEPCKMCKSERRVYKRWKKSQLALQKHENIIILNEPSCHMVVSNAGLGNGVSREEVSHIFTRFGPVLSISMKPDKSYCFVSMESEESAVCSYEDLNGRLLKCPEEISTLGLRFYLSYIENVPENEVVTGDLPNGLQIIEEFVDEVEEQMLLECIDWTTADKNMTPGARSSLKHRRVKHYGYEFLYGVNNVDINCPLEEAIPSKCSDIINRMLDQQLITDKPDQLTVNQYQPGQGIPPHIDTHSAFTDGIVSLSLGSQVVMDFRHPDGRHVPVLLPRRSLAVMSADSRYLWTHGIMQRKSDILPVSKVRCKAPNTRLSDERSDTKEVAANAGLSESLRDFSKKVYIESGVGTDVCSNQPETLMSSSDNKGHEYLDCSQGGVGDVLVTGFADPGVTLDGCETRVTETCVSNNGDLTLVHRGVRTSFSFRKILAKPCTCKYVEQCDSQHTPDKIVAQSDSSDTPTVSDKPAVPESDTEAQRLESKLVHQVYEEIAGHFSDTRHSPWPHVMDFLSSVPPGSVVLDVGCGNGKYLGASRDSFLVGCDRSENLCKICSSRGFPVFVCDCLAVPVRSNSVDVAISIAVIHHLSTKERRQAAVDEVIRVLRCGGQALIYVWALEQELNKKKSSYLKDSVANKVKGADSEANTDDNKNTDNSKESTGNAVPPCEDCCDLQEWSQVSSNQGHTSNDNKKKTLTVHKNRTAFESQDLLVPWHLRGQAGQKKSGEAGDNTTESSTGCSGGDVSHSKPSVYHRYYHVFRQGELEELCTAAVGGAEVVSSYYDQGNWCVILRKL